jgi:hypothetical protein
MSVPGLWRGGADLEEVRDMDDLKTEDAKIREKRPKGWRNDVRPPEKTALPIYAHARLVTRTALAILVALLALWVATDFLSALTWAAVIATTTWPIYVRSAALIPDGRSPLFAPMLFTLSNGLVFSFPSY